MKFGVETAIYLKRLFPIKRYVLRTAIDQVDNKQCKLCTNKVSSEDPVFKHPFMLVWNATGGRLQKPISHLCIWCAETKREHSLRFA